MTVRVPSERSGEISVAGDRLYYSIRFSQGQHTDELWVIESSGPAELIWTLPHQHYVAANQQFYFRSSDLLWTTDGSAEGVELVEIPGAIPRMPVFVPDSFAIANGHVFAFDVRGRLVSTDLANGTRTFLSPELTRVTARFHTVNDRLVIFLTARDVLQVVTSDGTLEGTTFEEVLSVGDVASENDVLFFVEEQSTREGTLNRVMRTDGTLEGTYSLFEYLGRLELHATTDALYVSEFNGKKLWEISGTDTPDGPPPTLLAELPGSLYFFTFTEIASSGQTVFFNAVDLRIGRGIWKIENNQDPIALDGSLLSASRLTPLPDGGLLFTAIDEVVGEELWRYESEAIAGDLNGNGRLDFADFLVLSENFGKQDALKSEGDLNGDTVVNFVDFLMLSLEFRDTASAIETRNE